MGDCRLLFEISSENTSGTICDQDCQINVDFPQVREAVLYPPLSMYACAKWVLKSFPLHQETHLDKKKSVWSLA